MKKRLNNHRVGTATFRLPQACLLNSQNRNADLRLVVEAPAFAARKVTLRK